MNDENIAEGYPGIAHDFETMRLERDRLLRERNTALSHLRTMTMNFRTCLLFVKDSEKRRLWVALVKDATALLDSLAPTEE